MDKLLAIIATLLGGGKFAGLTLAQIVAIAEVVKDNEPAIEDLISKGLPLAEKIAVVIKESYGKPMPEMSWDSLRDVWPP
jgi:hypothetical protein